jgi:cystathionine gamma-synthase
VAELDVICAAPRKRGSILGVDNTFATPLNQRPLAVGADVSVQSVTKFIGGHSGERDKGVINSGSIARDAAFS